MATGWVRVIRTPVKNNIMNVYIKYKLRHVCIHIDVYLICSGKSELSRGLLMRIQGK